MIIQCQYKLYNLNVIYMDSRNGQYSAVVNMKGKSSKITRQYSCSAFVVS